MTYSKEQIDVLLGIQINNEKSKTYYAAHGPGHLAGTILFIENNTNAWLQQKKSEDTNVKIILSDPFIINRPLSEFEIQFFSSLFKYYPVYFWPNTDVPVSFNEFLKERNKIKPDAEFNVRQTLARTGVQADPEHVIVLDTNNFSKIIAQQKIEYKLRDKKYVHDNKEHFDYFDYADADLNLSHTNMQNNEEKKLVFLGANPKVIKKINLRKPTESELKELSSRFPNLTTLQISGADAAWLKKYNYLLQDKKIELLDFYLDENPLILPENLIIERLQIGFIKEQTDEVLSNVVRVKQKNKSLKIFEIMDKVLAKKLVVELQDLFLESIEIPPVNYLTLEENIPNNLSKLKKLKCGGLLLGDRLDLSSATSLEYFEINTSNQNLSLTLPATASLKELKIDSMLSRLLAINKALKNVETLSIRNSQIRLELIDGMLPKLKSLHTHNSPYVRNNTKMKKTRQLEFFSSSTKFDETVSQQITSLVLIGKDHDIKLSTFPNLKKVYLAGEEYKKIVLLNCPEFEEIDIGFFLKEMPEIILPNPNKFQKLEVYNDYIPLTVILQNFKNFTSLSYGNMNEKDKNYIMPLIPNLVSLEIISFKFLQNLNLQNLLFLNILKFEDNENITQLNIPAGNLLKQLIISSCPKFFSDELATNTLINNLSQLEILKIKKAPFKSLNLSSLSALKEADISLTAESGVSLGPLSLNFKNNKNIKKLVVSIGRSDNDQEATVIDLTNCENLYEIEINCTGRVVLKGLSSCHNLRFARIQSENYPQEAFNLAGLDLKYTEAKSFSEKNPEIPVYKPEINFGFTDFATQDANFTSLEDEHDLNSMFMQLQDLHFQNERSATSCLSLSSGVCQPDGETEQKLTPSNFENAPLRGTLFDDSDISKDKDRFEVFDTIEWNDVTDDILFVSKIDAKEMRNVPANIGEEKQMLADYMQAKAQDPNLIIGNLKGNINAGRWYPLLTRQPPENKDSIKISSDNPNLEFFWYEPHKQYYCRLNAAAKAANEKVSNYYSLPKNLAYENENFSHQYFTVTEADYDKILPKKAREKLDLFFKDEIKVNNALAFIVDETLSVAEKLEKLKAYCTFEDVKKLEKKPENTFKLLLQIIHERKGACRHRAWVFMMLARYIGVPANNIINEMHSFCEMPYIREDTNQIDLQRIDMGGAFVIDKTPIEERKNPFEEYERENILKPKKIPTANQTQEINEALQKNGKQEINKTSKENEPKEINENPGAHKVYYKHFVSLREQVTIHNVERLLTTEKKAPVIELAPDQDPWTVSQEIRHQLALLNPNFNPKTDYFYIDHPKDFYTFLESYRLANGARTEKPIPGPLLDFINNPNGILVVNWSNFTPNDIANFKSVIDKDPFLLSHPSAVKKVIGLIKPNTIVSEDFSSRTRRLILAKDFFKQKPEKSKTKSSQKVIEIDLHNQADWREFLLGKVDIDGHQVHFRASSLLAAIERKESATAIISNLPDDPDCRRMLNHLQHEQKLFYNGVNYDVPNNLNITITTKSHELKLPDYITLHSASIDNLPSPSEAKYFNLYNWHEYFEAMQVHKDGTAKLSHQGDLADNDYVRFVITESMSKEYWNYLLSQIQQVHVDSNNKKKKFEFILAPGVTIKGVLENNTVSSVIKPIPIDEINTSSAPVYISNDPDYAALKLNEKYPDALFIDASSDADFSNLFASVTQTRTTTGYDFNYTEQAILSALKNKKKVILNVDLNESAYQQLLPFLKTPTKMKINGEIIDLTGELILVLPQQVAKNFHLLTPTIESKVTWEDYYKVFPKDKDTLDKLKSFYTLAERFPHRGAGRPKEPRLSYYRLKTLIAATQSKSVLHGNNPLKNHFHYDYPKNSKDYAYLNVIAKWHFSTVPEKDINSRKLNQYIEQFGGFTPAIFKENIWYFLNCCNGPLLREILGPDLDNVLMTSVNEIPKIKDVDFDRIFKIIKKLHDKTENLKESHSRTYKLEIAFKEFLENDNLSIFFLKGDPGVGKTHSTKLFAKQPGVCLIKGKNAIVRWLNAKPSSTDKYPVLFWDEMNDADPGTLDFLKAIGKAKKENQADDQGNIKILYAGQIYKITNHHRIFATGNFEYTQHRHYQTLLQDFAYTFYLPKPNEAELIEKVLAPQLQHLLGSVDYKQSERFFLDVYQNLPKFNPHIILSLRDMHNLVSRFKTLWHESHYENNNNNAEQNLDVTLFEAASGEFAAMIPENNQRQQFIKFLRTKLELQNQQDKKPELIELSDGIMIPSEKEYLVKAIEQDLLIQRNSKTILNQNYKQAVLLEGGSGVGKSTMLEGVLKKNGFSLNAEDPLKRYYIVSGGDKNAYDVLKKACREGSKIILNELNLFDERVNKLLLHVLNIHDKDKTNENKQDDEELILHPETFIFASQNPGYFPGRNIVDDPIRNRVHFLYMDAYSDTELEKFARFYKIENPRAFVQAYKKAHEEFPTIINMRTFFEELQHLSLQPLAIPFEIIQEEAIQKEAVETETDETETEEEEAGQKESVGVEKTEIFPAIMQPVQVPFIKEREPENDAMEQKDRSVIDDIDDVFTFLEDLRWELDLNKIFPSYIGKGFLFLTPKTPKHIAELNKKIAEFNDHYERDSENTDINQLAIDVVKILIHAKDNHSVFRSQATANFYTQYLEKGLKTLDMTEDDFRRKYGMELPHIFEARFLKHRRNF